MFINLTPHEVRVVKEKDIMVIPPSGIVARCEQREEVIGEIEGVRVTRLVMGRLVNLPAPKKGVTYIVSHIVLQEARERTDLVKPGELVRDETGAIIGCKSFCRL